MNIGTKPVWSKHGLLTTVAWQIGGETTYALEGSAFIAGAAVQWLRDGLGLIKSAAEIEALAREGRVERRRHVRARARRASARRTGIKARAARSPGSRAARRAAHLARATLEGIAFEVCDLLEAMSKDAGRDLAQLRVDGGAARNDLLMQFQADIARASQSSGPTRSSRPAAAPRCSRASAPASSLVTPRRSSSRSSAPSSLRNDGMSQADRDAHVSRWRDAVARTRTH